MIIEYMKAMDCMSNCLIFMTKHLNIESNLYDIAKLRLGAWILMGGGKKNDICPLAICRNYLI